MNKAKVAAVRTRKANTRRRPKAKNDARGNGAIGRNGARRRSESRAHRPYSELEAAIERYADLYDIPDRKKAEQKVEWLAAYPRENPNPILELDLDTNEISYANPATLKSFPDLERLGLRDPFLVRILAAGTPLFEDRIGPIHAEIDLAKSCYAVAIVRVPRTRRLRVYSVDITQRKKQEKRLAEQTRLLDLTHDAIIVRDPQDRIVYWNRGAEEMYGYKREEALGKITHELLRTEHPESLQSINQQLERDNSWSGELTHIRRDGKQITVLSRWSLDRDSRGRMTFVLQTNTDITKVKKTEAELRRSKEMLERLIQQRTKALRAANTELQTEISRRKGLEGQILEISDREQERLGQELHDGLCQQLTAIGFLARATALRLKDHRVVQTEDLEKLAQLINSSVMDARNIAHDLHKEEIDAAEFPTALRALVERKIWKTPCRLDLKTEVSIEDDKVASQLYRILREAVINANKHARATQIVLEVRRVRNELVFSVTDNGVGLSKKPKTSQGLGFHIMQYRAQSIGARLEFESRKKSGSRVACYLPLS